VVVGVPGNHFAVLVGVGPAATVRILRIEVRIAGQLLQPAVAEQLPKANVVKSLPADVGLKDRTTIGDETGDRPLNELETRNRFELLWIPSGGQDKINKRSWFVPPFPSLPVARKKSRHVSLGPIAGRSHRFPHP
jgi:hypothetical protein